MSNTLKGLAALLLLAAGAGGAAMARSAEATIVEEPPHDVPAVLPASAAGAERDEVRSFLRDASATFQAAEAACFAAEQCGTVERTPSQGSLGSVSEMPACLEARVQDCSVRAEQLGRLVPPPAIASLWEGAVKFRVLVPLKHALLTQEYVQASGTADLRPSSKGNLELEDWVADQELPIAARYASLREESRAWQEATLALDEWTRTNAVCARSERCGLNKALAEFTEP